MALKQDNSTGYAALRDGAGLVDAADSGRVLLTGADRRSYLQGLLTNDIEALTPGSGCYAAMLTAQGRMMTDMRVLELGDSLLLELPAAATAAVRDHLDRFVFTEDVAVADVTATRGQVGVYGPRAADVVAGAGVNDAPTAPMFASRRVRIAGADAILVRSDRPGIPGFEIIADAAAMPPIEAALAAAGAVRASAADVEAVRIESGRPRFGADTGADTIPLEAGLEDRAISRTKGCYVGQEVIVRVIDRGHGRVARRLVGLTLPAAAPLPVAGAPLRSGDKEIGRVTSAAFSPRLATPIALGYVQRDFVEPGTTVQIEGSGTAAVASLPLVPLQ